jgi:hypothetical protein
VYLFVPSIPVPLSYTETLNTTSIGSYEGSTTFTPTTSYTLCLPREVGGSCWPVTWPVATIGGRAYTFISAITSTFTSVFMTINPFTSTGYTSAVIPFASYQVGKVAAVTLAIALAGAVFLFMLNRRKSGQKK